jgi:murein DD-endopeptidase MepM/ murein hydrolase activator NlpD
MIRLLLGFTAVVVAGGAAAATAGTIQASHAVLSSPLGAGTPGATVDDGPDHTAVVHVPPGMTITAVSAGVVAHPDAAHITVRGTGDDAGLDVEYTGVVAGATGAGSVQRGDPVGSAPPAPAAIGIRAVLDGRPLDTAALLRHALRSGGADVVAGWTRPVDSAWVSQPFGCTAYSIEPLDRACPGGHIHTGIDLAAPRGTPVRAALDGVVRVVVSTNGYGLHVVVDHGNGLTTLYGHLDSVTMQDGEEVSAGYVVGMVGSSGNSTGPHLHFEVRRDGIAEDPTLDVALP